MGDDGSSRKIFKGFMDEWTLFWDGLKSTEGDGANIISNRREAGNLEALTSAEVKDITKKLSEDRKKLNQKLESINKEIEEYTEKLEGVRLVGGDDEDVVKQIGKLSEFGYKVASELDKLNKKIDFARKQEDELRKPRTDS